MLDLQVTPAGRDVSMAEACMSDDLETHGLQVSGAVRHCIDGGVFASLDDAVSAIYDVIRELGEASRFTRPNGTVSLALIPGDDSPLPLRELVVVLDTCPDLLSEEDLLKTCREYASCQLPDGQFPDLIEADGTPIYNTHGNPDLQVPNVDCAQYMVWLAWLTVQRTGNAELGDELAPKLVKALQALPRGDRTQLVHVADEVRNFGATCPFAPGARKRGDLLNSSLLLAQAYQQLADIMQHLRRDGDADMWRAEAQLVAKRVRMYFWDKNLGLFRAATRRCTEHDIWGSVFSVYLNVATSGQLVAISRYCSEHLGEVVKRGHVRGMPPGELWADCDIPAGEFENGGYWSGAAGWLAYTLDILDPGMADRLVMDLARQFVEKGVCKAINGKGIERFRDYLPSAAAPMPGIQKMLARRRKRAEQTALIGDV